MQQSHISKQRHGTHHSPSDTHWFPREWHFGLYVQFFYKGQCVGLIFLKIFASETRGQHRMLQHSLLPGPAHSGHPHSPHSSKTPAGISTSLSAPQDEPWVKLHFGSLNFSENRLFPFGILLAFQINLAALQSRRSCFSKTGKRHRAVSPEHVAN